MAYDFVRSSSQYLQGASLSSSIVAPFTLSALAYSVDTSNTQYIFIVRDNKLTLVDAHALVLRGAVAGDPLDATSRTDDGNPPTGQALSTTSYPSSTWFAAAGVFSATNSRTVYLDGGSSATNTQNVPITDIVIPQISGIPAGGSQLAFLDGRAAEVALWSAALTADEVASLAKGFKPTRIRPQSLVFYAPLIRDLQDVRGGLAITNNNSATVANHPRVY
jgi:hypothetical protein